MRRRCVIRWSSSNEPLGLITDAMFRPTGLASDPAKTEDEAEPGRCPRCCRVCYNRLLGFWLLVSGSCSLGVVCRDRESEIREPEPETRNQEPKVSSKRDYYEVLEVRREANDQELKTAYRRLALKYHPDKNPGDHRAEERFKELNEAYQVLSQAELRERYDRFGHAGVGAGAAAGAGFGQGFPGFEDLFDMFGMGDIFGGRTRRRAGPRRGSDLRYDIELTLEEAATGLKTRFACRGWKLAKPVAGPAAAEGSQPVRCSACAGSGQVRISRDSSRSAGLAPLSRRREGDQRRVPRMPRRGPR